MLEEARESTDEAREPGVRVDWRTGKPMVQHDEAYWREHERRRLELGMSVRQYCAANDLALSTYRHRVSSKKRASAKTTTGSPSPAFVAVTPPPAAAAAVIEVALDGMTMRLCGSAAERVLARVIERLA
jgi:hypothetical protein